MTRLGRLLGLAVAIGGGFLAAHVLVQAGNAQVPPLPTVSVTVPSVPVPTTPVPVPVPSTPTPTVPVPPPTTAVPVPTPAPVPAPTVPVPVPAPVPAPAPAPAPAPVPAAALPARPAPPALPATPTVSTPRPAAAAAPVLRSAPSTAARSAASAGQQGPPRGDTIVVLVGAPSGSSAGTTPAGRTAAPGAKARGARKLDARRLRTRNRVSVRLDFTLPQADRLFLIVRGPAPSCRIAGYIPVRGRKGANTVAFSGRVHGRRLEPGIYLISLSQTRRFTPGAPTEYVRVVSPRRSVPLPDSASKPSCREAALLATDSTARILLTEAVAPPAPPTARPASVQTPTKAAPDRTGDEDDEAASGFVPDAGILGVATGDGAEQPFVAIAVLSLVAVLLLAMLALVTRFFRGSWNP